MVSGQTAHPGLLLAVEYKLIRSGKSQEECFAQYTALYLAQFVGLKIPLVWVSSSMITYPANISSFRPVKVMVISLRQSLLEWDEN